MQTERMQQFESLISKLSSSELPSLWKYLKATIGEVGVGVGRFIHPSCNKETPNVLYHISISKSPPLNQRILSTESISNLKFEMGTVIANRCCMFLSCRACTRELWGLTTPLHLQMGDLVIELSSP